MRASTPYLVDGVLTGLALAGLLALVCLVRGLSWADCGGWMFLSGVGLAVVSAPLAIHTGRSPGGLLTLLRRRPPEPERARLWLDRFVSPRNVWLIAGLTLMAVSFLPPFLRWRG